jgi:hypothetical protein
MKRNPSAKQMFNVIKIAKFMLGIQASYTFKKMMEHNLFEACMTMTQHYPLEYVKQKQNATI